MRKANIVRKTGETDVSILLNLDGTGAFKGKTECGFFDHMLELFSMHGRFDIEVQATGDYRVDDHHTVEDVGIAMGQAFAQALGEKKGIQRYADITLPMDEALVLCAIDLSGRSYLGYDVQIPAQKVGEFDTELCYEFFCGFIREIGASLHIKMLSGLNSHHIIEAIFKAVGRVLASAVKIDQRYSSQIPSTKGVI